MVNIKSKEMLSAGLMGVGGFDLTTKPLYPIKYLAPTFIISLAVWLYCFYVNRSVRKYEKQNSRDSIL